MQRVRPHQGKDALGVKAARTWLVLPALEHALLQGSGQRWLQLLRKLALPELGRQLSWQVQENWSGRMR